MSYTTSANFGSPRGCFKSLKSLFPLRCHGSVLGRTDWLTGRLSVRRKTLNLSALILSCAAKCVPSPPETTTATFPVGYLLIAS
jgi:hypothetical protein